MISTFPCHVHIYIPPWHVLLVCFSLLQGKWKLLDRKAKFMFYLTCKWKLFTKPFLITFLQARLSLHIVKNPLTIVQGTIWCYITPELYNDRSLRINIFWQKSQPVYYIQVCVNNLTITLLVMLIFLFQVKITEEMRTRVVNINHLSSFNKCRQNY